jgi:hypothetical protein
MCATPTHSGSAFILDDEGPADGGRLRVLLGQSLTYTLTASLCVTLVPPLVAESMWPIPGERLPRSGFSGEGIVGASATLTTLPRIDARAASSRFRTDHSQMPTRAGDVGSGLGLLLNPTLLKMAHHGAVP